MHHWITLLQQALTNNCLKCGSVALCEIAYRTLDFCRPHILGRRIDEIAEPINRDRLSHHGLRCTIPTNDKTWRRFLVFQIPIKPVSSIGPTCRDMRKL